MHCWLYLTLLNSSWVTADNPEMLQTQNFLLVDSNGSVYPRSVKKFSD